MPHLGWLRVAVLGANDGLISTASLVGGVATSGISLSAVLLSGVARPVAGAMSMAAGESVSVSSQADSERADLARERAAHPSRPRCTWRECRLLQVSAEAGIPGTAGLGEVPAIRPRPRRASPSGYLGPAIGRRMAA